MLAFLSDRLEKVRNRAVKANLPKAGWSTRCLSGLKDDSLEAAIWWRQLVQDLLDIIHFTSKVVVLVLVLFHPPKHKVRREVIFCYVFEVSIRSIRHDVIGQIRCYFLMQYFKTYFVINKCKPINMHHYLLPYIVNFFEASTLHLDVQINPLLALYRRHYYTMLH